MAAPNPDLFSEAVAHFRARVPMTDKRYKALDDKARRRAFGVAGVAQLDLVSDVWLALDKALTDGTSFEDFQALVGDRLAAAWGTEQPHRVDTIFRTNVQTAYGAGRWAQLTDPAVMKVRPFWKYSVVLDSRTSEICSKLADTVRPADDPFWETHNPPLHFNCRSAVIALTEAQADAAGVSDKAPKVDPQEGFGAAPGADEWQPDLKAYPPALAKIFNAGQ